MISEDYVNSILKRLKKRYMGGMRTFLTHSNAWELLVATMLSAQAQDAQVNRITPGLFSRYKTVRDYTGLRPSELYKYTGSIGLFRSKSRNIVNAARAITSRFNGTVPSTIEELTTLPGVGRKTANVVLANHFKKNHGIAIDTHCITVSRRLFLFRTRNAEKIERKLMEYVPRKDWGNINNLFIALGRDVCTARTKRCEGCVLNDICPSSTMGGKR